MTSEEISESTGVDFEIIQGILKKSLESLAQRGITEEHLERCSK